MDPTFTLFLLIWSTYRLLSGVSIFHCELPPHCIQLPREAPITACLHEEDGCTADTAALTVSRAVSPSQLEQWAVRTCPSLHGCVFSWRSWNPTQACRYKAAHYFWTLSHFLWTHLLSVWMGSLAFFNAAIYYIYIAAYCPFFHWVSWSAEIVGDV